MKYESRTNQHRRQESDVYCIGVIISDASIVDNTLIYMAFMLITTFHILVVVKRILEIL